MDAKRRGYGVVGLLLIGLFALAVQVSAAPNFVTPPPPATPTGRVATEAELAAARAAWLKSAHADTYDNGMGANTTCARCKSPFNWDPTQELAQQEALDCGACKRVPGAPRPELASGVVVAERDWQDIDCAVCHVPVGDSYDTGIAFWNQALGQYEAVADVTELCAKCHEGRHGFEVVEEQVASTAHENWDCVACHGPHGSPSACSDCHYTDAGPGILAHDQHPSVNCTGCHDQGDLSIWFEADPQSAHYGEYITRRFAHALTSWPSHNLSVEVECERCHHPLDDQSAAVVPEVRCEACHEHDYGAVWVWCINFERNPDPNAGQIEVP